MAGESLTSNARRALPIRNRFTNPSNEKPFSVGMASSPSSTNLFGLRARKAAAISGKAEVRLFPVLDCKKTFSSSRKTRQRNRPLRAVHPFFTNGKAFHGPSLHRGNRRTEKFVYRVFGGHHIKRNLLRKKGQEQDFRDARTKYNRKPPDIKRFGVSARGTVCNESLRLGAGIAARAAKVGS